MAESPMQINGIFPSLTVMSKGVGSRTETGIGALIPWAEKLWAVGYVAHIHGEGIGLYEISDDMTMRLHPESVTGTFANRMVHWPSDQAIIGPHIIDAEGGVRTFAELSKHRLTATMQHLSEPDDKVYFLTMEGLLFEADVRSLAVTQLADVVKELDLPPDSTPHFKGGHTAHGRVVVANNTYDEHEFLGGRAAGRLAEWDGEKWTVLEENPFVEVYGVRKYGAPIFATGWDRASVILKLFTGSEWTTYRLPKASHAYDHTWNTEWCRIRPVMTERFLMDVHGMFYELPAIVYSGRTWGIRPVCAHLRMVPDFVTWRGMLVLASDQADQDIGQPQSGLWFGKMDDLWSFGKPRGWGGPWWDTPARAGVPSDPFLMTGFDGKCLHLAHKGGEAVEFTVEVDFLGDGSWHTYGSIPVPPGGYKHHEFPLGFSAHWVRVTVDRDCTATASFAYT